MASNISISAIIPFHRGGPTLDRCCDALLAVSTESPLEIIAVADGVVDGSDDRLEARGLRVLRIPGPGGPARARNHGARAARGELLFFLDADTAVHRSTIATVQREFALHPEIAALIGSYDDAPPAAGTISQYKNLLQHYVHQNANEEGFTFWGACGAIRRDLFLELGGFDERYTTPSIEDIELGYRLTAAGHRVRLCKELWVTHLKRWTARSLLASDLLRRAIPWTRLILRSGAFQNDLNIDVAARLKVAAACGLVGLLLLSVPWPPSLLPASCLVGGLFVADLPLWRFFQAKRGACFATVALGWHWLSYVYSGLGFAVGLVAHLYDRRRRAARAGSEAAPSSVSR